MVAVLRLALHPHPTPFTLIHGQAASHRGHFVAIPAPIRVLRPPVRLSLSRLPPARHERPPARRRAPCCDCRWPPPGPLLGVRHPRRGRPARPGVRPPASLGPVPAALRWVKSQRGTSAISPVPGAAGAGSPRPGNGSDRERQQLPRRRHGPASGQLLPRMQGMRFPPVVGARHAATVVAFLLPTCSSSTRGTSGGGRGVTHRGGRPC